MCVALCCQLTGSLCPGLHGLDFSVTTHASHLVVQFMGSIELLSLAAGSLRMRCNKSIDVLDKYGLKKLLQFIPKLCKVL